ncbi:MAG TPA: ferrochelatase [Aldersonia sp.]
MTTGVVMMNMGGPWTLDDVEPFLHRLFEDIIELPARWVLRPLLVRARAPRVRRQYEAIGGGSPQRDWTTRQAAAMAAELDAISPGTGPHLVYPTFRYAEPSAETVLERMRADGVRRAVAFPQYPHCSATTTGTSLADLWRAVARAGLDESFDWDVIDRWPTHPAYIDALAETVRKGLDAFARPEAVPVLFSAHSLPIRTVARGESYPLESAATVRAVMDRLAVPNPYLLAYQSKVGPMRWLGPSTADTVERLAAHGATRLLLVAVSFICDHLETLWELDVELAETARRAGITELRRAPALNDRPAFTRALARIVADRLAVKSPTREAGTREEMKK